MAEDNNEQMVKNMSVLSNDRITAEIATTEKLLSFSAENVSALLEVKGTSEEIALSVQRLFKATEDSYSVVLQMNQAAKAIAENAGSASSAVEDTSASVEEVGASVREVEEHAILSSSLLKKSRRSPRPRA
jgi:methyl-accepting chemotaxis protein